MRYELRNLLNQINTNFNELYTKIKSLKNGSNLKEIEYRMTKSQMVIDDILTCENHIILVESLDYLYAEIKVLDVLLKQSQVEELKDITYKICWYIRESTKSAMRIVLGFVKDNFKFTLEEEFDYSACYMQTKKDSYISELYINQHLERNKIPYGVTISKDEFKLTASGIKRDYVLQLGDYYLYSIDGGFQVYNNKLRGSQDVFFEAKSSTHDILLQNKLNPKREKVLNEKQLKEKDIIKKANYYINKYDSYYKNIINKKFLKTELQTNLENIILIYGEKNIERYFDVEKFFIKCINKEKACEYIKKNATYSNLLLNKPNIVSFDLSKTEIEYILRNTLKDYFEINSGELIFDEIDEKDDIDAKKEVQHIFSSSYCLAEKNSLEKKKKTIKKDYSYELILELFNKSILEIKSKAFFEKKLMKYLKDIQFNGKIEYLNKIDGFIKKYINYEKKLLFLIDKYNSTEVVINLTKEKQEKFKNYELGNIELNELEKLEYEHVYLKTFPLFESIIYLKNGKGIKPTFTNFPRYIKWAEELLSWIEENKVIKIGSKGQTQLSYKTIKKIPNRLQNYFNYKTDEDYIVPIENKIVKEIELTIPEFIKTTKNKSEVDVILDSEFDNYIEVTKKKGSIIWTTKKQITQLFLFRILYKLINEYHESFKGKNTVSFGYFSSDGWDSVVKCKATDLTNIYDKLLTKQMQYLKPVIITMSCVNKRCSIEVRLSNRKKSLRYIGRYEYKNNYLINLEI